MRMSILRTLCAAASSNLVYFQYKVEAIKKIKFDVSFFWLCTCISLCVFVCVCVCVCVCVKSKIFDLVQSIREDYLHFLVNLVTDQ